MPKLILVRHGESEWNKSDRFNGWVDTRLTEKGKQEARHIGALLREFNLQPQIVFTSKLSRTIQTANLVLEELDRLWVDIVHTWHLNERHYGALQGRSKNEVLESVGHDKFMLWRRSYDHPPPPIPDNDMWSPIRDERYSDIPADAFPRTESLKMVVERLVPYFQEKIAPELRSGKQVLIVAHGNSLRALVKYLSNLSDSEISKLNLATGMPFVYEMNEDLTPIKDRYYLDPEAAAAGAAKVAQQGQQEQK